MAGNPLIVVYMLNVLVPLLSATSAIAYETPLDRAVIEAQELRRAADDFAASHPANGRNALVYFRGLRDEGFTCIARMFDETIAGTGVELGQLRARKSPIVDCARVPARLPSCARLRVTAITDGDAVRDLTSFVKSLRTAKVTRSFFVCEPSLEGEGAKNFDADLKSGSAVLVR